ncbi:MAG: hypothetical protein QF880_04645 [Candidatus Poseidonia sp.]|nr:hypothetical protein [Poseidonia sp.]
MAETFWSLEDDEDLPPPVKAAGQPERSTPVQQPSAHHGVETIPLRHSYDDLIALAVCFVPTVWTLFIAEIWYFFFFLSLSTFIGLVSVLKRQERAFVMWYPAQRRLEFFRGKRRSGVNPIFSYIVQQGDAILGLMIQPSETEDEGKAKEFSLFTEVAELMFPFLMFTQSDLKDMAEDDSDERYWFEVLRKDAEKPEYFPEHGKELTWKYQFDGLEKIMKDKLEWVESQQ